MFDKASVDARLKQNSGTIEATKQQYDYQTPWYKVLGATKTIHEMVIFMKDKLQSPGMYQVDELTEDLQHIEDLTREVLK